MSDLTEQLVKGTLKEYTYYYVLRNNGKTDIKMWTNKKYSSAVDWFNTYDVKEVLAEVPSYEEWKTIQEENKQIKELLKECLNTIYSDCSVLYLVKLSEKIDKMLGETICKEKSIFDEKEYYKALFKENDK